jgi:hypothetical protein
MAIRSIINLLILTTFLTSCGTTQHGDKESGNPKDTVFVEMNNDGPVLLPTQTGTSGENISRDQIVFKEIGQEQQFNIGDKVQLIFEGVSPQDADLNYSIHPKTGIVLIKLVKKGVVPEVIKFDDICQIFVVGQGNFPKFEVTDTLIGKQQLIITPVVNDECQVIGYEMRYGSIDDANCQTGRKNLRRFQNCMKYGRIASPPAKEKNWKRYFVK